MRRINSKLIKHSDMICSAQMLQIGIGLAWLITPTMAASIYENDFMIGGKGRNVTPLFPIPERHAHPMCEHKRGA